MVHTISIKKEIVLDGDYISKVKESKVNTTPR